MEQGPLKESTSDPGEEMTEESFLKDLYFFMKQSDNPIERVPHLGFKQSTCKKQRNIQPKSFF